MSVTNGHTPVSDGASDTAKGPSREKSLDEETAQGRFSPHVGHSGKDNESTGATTGTSTIPSGTGSNGNARTKPSKESGAPGGENVRARGGKETIGDEDGPGGDVSTDPVVSGDTSNNGYTSAVTETQSSRTQLGDINTDDAAIDKTGSSGVG